MKLNIAALVTGLVVLVWAYAIDDRAGRAACEQAHSAATCAHIIRG